MDTPSEKRQQRRAALDDFAARTVPEATAMVPVTMAPPAEYIHGAQNVAIYRDERQVLNRIRELAAAAGQDWYFRFPVRNKKANTTEWIEGPSIQLALDVARIYGNCEIDCRAQDLGGVILFHARLHDVETGFSLTRPFQQRKGASRLGGADEGRRDDIDFQIGASKAIRNVVVNALQYLCQFRVRRGQGGAGRQDRQPDRPLPPHDRRAHRETGAAGARRGGDRTQGGRLARPQTSPV